MSSSLIKFLNQQQQGGNNGRGKLFWGRIDQDGLPFRGPQPPNLTEEEYNDRVVRVADPHNGTFRTWVAEENQAYLEVLDQILNKWAVCLFQKSWKEKVKLDGKVQQRYVHYVVWAKYYLEDGQRTRTGLTEVFNG
jgi:hypothetical protein